MAPTKGGKFMDVLDVLSSDSDSEEPEVPEAGGQDSAAPGQPQAPDPAADRATEAEDVPEAGATAAVASKADAAECSSSGSEGEDEDEAELAAAAAKRRRGEVTLEQLQAAGYRSGPSVLFIRPKAEEGQQSWDWGSGREAKAAEPQEETVEDRLRTAEAVTVGVVESAEFAMRALQQAEALRAAAREEKAAAAADKRLSFNHKEKRKREAGQATRGKNFVEEEKRLQRQFNIYSGFD